MKFYIFSATATQGYDLFTTVGCGSYPDSVAARMAAIEKLIQVHPEVNLENARLRVENEVVKDDEIKRAFIGLMAKD